MENNKKSRLAEILGVEELEEWTVNLNLPDDNNFVYRINNGVREVKAKNDSYDWEREYDENSLVEIINNPSLIVKKPKWTEKEIEYAKAVKLIFPWTEYLNFHINEYDDIEINENELVVHSGYDNFVKMKSGTNIWLKDILGEDCK